MGDYNINSNHGFQGWVQHSERSREDSELVALQALRNAHPEYHVTRTAPSKCDLLGYARAGHASATRDDDELYDALRAYQEPGSRLVKEPGVLADQVKFGRWSYTWEQKDYFVYEVEFHVTFMPPKKLLYVLSLRSQDSKPMKYHAATDELLMAAGTWSTDLHEEIYVFDDASWTKDKELWKSVQDASWDEVILNPDMKANLIKDVQGFFDNQELYKKLAVPWKRGVILHGVPGNGKTISIKALINSLASRPEPVPSLYVKSFDSCNGPKWSIRSIFKQARTMAPCLLIFEDLDSLVEKKTRSYFLNEVDGLESNDGILMIGSTNHLDQLDPAISKRPSRFDRKYHFKVPSEEERVAYCKYWRQKLVDSDLVEFPEALCPIIAKMTEGFSFAYLKELFIIALLTIARGAVDDLESSDCGSSTDGVIVDREQASVATDKEVTKSGPKERRVMPEVDIPVSLQDNLLLRAVRIQCKLLLDEMDNTDEEDGPLDKQKSGESRAGAIFAAAAAMRAAARSESSMVGSQFN